MDREEYRCLCCGRIDDLFANGLCPSCNKYQRKRDEQEVEETKRQLAVIEEVLSWRLTQSEAYYLYHLVSSDGTWEGSPQELAKKQAILRKLASCF